MFRGDDWALLRNERCTKAKACHGFAIIELDGERWELLDSTGAQAGHTKPSKGVAQHR